MRSPERMGSSLPNIEARAQATMQKHGLTAALDQLGRVKNLLAQDRRLQRRSPQEIQDSLRDLEELEERLRAVAAAGRATARPSSRFQTPAPKPSTAAPGPPKSPRSSGF